MRHQQHVPSSVILVVEGEKVDLAKHGTGSDNAFAILKEVAAEGLNKSSSISCLASRCDSGIEVRRDGFPCSLFEDGDNLRRLETILSVHDRPQR